MNGHSIALLLLAAAVELTSDADVARLRLEQLTGRPRRRVWTRLTPPKPPPPVLAAMSGVLVTVVAGPAAGAVVAVGVWWFLRRARRPPAADPMTVAATWDLLAACLRAGLPVPTAMTVVADELPAEAARALRSSADLLALGADPATAWEPATSCPDTAPLARGARRTTQSGTALADLVTDLAAKVRTAAADNAEATAQRAGVLITAPLGLCFLPAFVCLGVAPVIAGLAGQMSL
ncbi:type II secretion system F family protein [Actinophytocola sp. NPDC049390]|uniref:type II secretion system F family protein n=1 Tax=Actinophytocola sp. NPDC049390 TaxID=3363894 RepID=UPI00379967E2